MNSDIVFCIGIACISYTAFAIASAGIRVILSQVIENILHVSFNYISRHEVIMIDYIISLIFTIGVFILMLSTR